MTNWYLTIVCKTPDCGRRDARCYIGEYAAGQTFTLPVQVPFEETLTCPACNKTHTYTNQDLKAAPMPFPPPEGFPRAF
jgi:hypothetical protein